MTERIDPYSGETFSPKRTNQLFASRKNQVAYNNARAKSQRDQLTLIDNQIRKNWQILVNLLGESSLVKKSKDFLWGAGYDFKYFNNYREHEGKPYYGVYGIGIRNISETSFEIIKFENHE